MTYKIRIKTVDEKILTFTNVDSFSIKDSLVCFIDSKTGLEKKFSSERTDIEEEQSFKGESEGRG